MYMTVVSHAILMGIYLQSRRRINSNLKVFADYADSQRGTRQKIARQDFLTNQCLHMSLQKAAQRSGTIYRVISVFYDIVFGFICEYASELSVLQPFVQSCQQQINDGSNILFG